VLFPGHVQGELAVGEICSGISYFNIEKNVDVIIVGRGGGSMEDLWEFNNEDLARTIYAAKTPIISAVGHEIDFTICDFVSDLRAPTPSAAAELAVPDKRDLLLQVDSLDGRLLLALNRTVSRAKERLEGLSERADAESMVKMLSRKADGVAVLSDKANILMQGILLSKREAFLREAAKANALSPLSILSRGYSVAEHDGMVLKSVGGVKPGDEITLIVNDGRIKTEVTEVEGENDEENRF
jgi:exodeoxyribonuclease VII large subunit